METQQVETRTIVLFTELKPGISLVGLEPNLVCTVIAVVPIGTASVQVVYKLPDVVKTRMDFGILR